jgi:PPOX class probable F420-dependent enzyme
MALDPDLKAFADAKNFAALTTLMPDGQPQTQVMWVGADDEHLLINTEVHRAKYKNASRDPRVTVTVWDADNPYRYVEARGRVVEEVRGDAARANIDELAQKYMGTEYQNPIQSERVVLKVAVETVHKNNV